jgi:hypothetical protein
MANGDLETARDHSIRLSRRLPLQPMTLAIRNHNLSLSLHMHLHLHLNQQRAVDGGEDYYPPRQLLSAKHKPQ